MLVLAFGKNIFEFSNYPNTLIVDQMEGTGAVSAKLSSVTTI
jgi:hypothetical protein